MRARTTQSDSHSGELWVGGGEQRLQWVVGGGSPEGQGEVEALAEALKGQEGVRREVAGGHLAVGLLEASRWTVALEAAHQQVDAGAAVLAHGRRTSAGAGRQLAALACPEGGERELIFCPLWRNLI